MKFSELINYELVPANPIWRFGLMLIIIIATLIVGRIVQFYISLFVKSKKRKDTENVRSLFLNALSKPISLAFFAVAVQLSRLCLKFDNPDTTEAIEGIRSSIYLGWGKTTQAMWGIFLAYGLYHLVDVVEHYLYKFTSKTKTKLDDMLVPVVRKSLRITITIVAVLIVAENIFGTEHIKSLLLSAGVGGFAIAFAAKDTIANFFGSFTIFADRPFQIDELVKIGDNTGIVEEVGFRSTRIRTLSGHLITIPNSTVANANIENIGRRPFVRRTTEITITYDSGIKKAEKATEIIKQILAETPEINTNPTKQPRVYFSEFASCSLNIYVSYWVVPADYWVYQAVNERINFEILKKFGAEGIEFAFPTQTLYVKKDSETENA